VIAVDTNLLVYAHRSRFPELTVVNPPSEGWTGSGL
jgi:hypothetical protein